MSDRETVKQALYTAIDWETSLLDAYSHMPNDPQVVLIKNRIKAYRSLLRRRYKETGDTPQERIGEGMETVGLLSFAFTSQPKVTDPST